MEISDNSLLNKKPFLKLYFSFLIKQQLKFNIARTIDHTLLKSNSTYDEIKKLCLEAVKYKFYSVCINPYFISYAKSLLNDSNVKVCTVIGFPLGANSTKTKVYEAIDAVTNGAEEIDMVINISALKSRNSDYIYNEIKEVVDAIPSNITVKVILETCYLNEEEIELACIAAVKANAKFVKTSTGFGSRGASIEDIKSMKSYIRNNCDIKASGGIRDLQALKDMIKAGASRIGTSSGLKILEEIDKFKI